MPELRSARALSRLSTITMRLAPRERATAAVVKARNTSMITVVPTASVAPLIKLARRISMSPPIGALPLQRSMKHGTRRRAKWRCRVHLFIAGINRLARKESFELHEELLKVRMARPEWFGWLIAAPALVC